jgi:diketogulonate reductase-like aldo/keto reductase
MRASLRRGRFGLEEVKEVLASCNVVPAVNMIMLNPNTLPDMSALLVLMDQSGIVPGGYSSLKPLWDADGNPAIVNQAEVLARRKGANAEHVLLRWCRAKG